MKKTPRPRLCSISFSEPEANTTDLTPTSRAPSAAFTLASMPPRPPLEIPPNFQSFNEGGVHLSHQPRSRFRRRPIVQPLHVGQA